MAEELNCYNREDRALMGKINGKIARALRAKGRKVETTTIMGADGDRRITKIDGFRLKIEVKRCTDKEGKKTGALMVGWSGRESRGRKLRRRVAGNRAGLDYGAIVTVMEKWIALRVELRAECKAEEAAEDARDLALRKMNEEYGVVYPEESWADPKGAVINQFIARGGYSVVGLRDLTEKQARAIMKVAQDLGLTGEAKEDEAVA